MSASNSTAGTCRRSIRHHAIDQSENLLRRRFRVRTQEHHLGRGPRPRSRDLDRSSVQRQGREADRPPPLVNLISQKMGIHEWSYDNDISNDLRYKVPHAPKEIDAEEREDRSRTGLRSEGSAFSKRNVASIAISKRCSRPSSASNATPASTSARWIASPLRRMATKTICACASRRLRPTPRRTFTSPKSLKTGRVMVKDEDMCLHCGLCAERCPTGAWDMKKFYLEPAQAESCRSL
jgi:formate dehydrogenase (NADP+) beta subunit